jgi:CelD/BcsL family acetyltransferase involved in cellulose biosynthesis
MSSTAADRTLTLRSWSLAEWLGSEQIWDNLLARSNADPLFLSWEWLTQWWHCFSGQLGASSDIRAFYRGPELVGIAPLYRRRMVRSGLMPVNSVQLIGLSWRDPAPLMSEYLDVIAVQGEADAVRQACAGALQQERLWTESVIGFTAAGSQWRDAFAPCRGRQYIREVDHSVSYQADLTHGFATYLGDLGQSTRRSIWHLRRRLAEHGSVRFELLGAQQIEDGVSHLNRLHELRWERPAFTGPRLLFQANIADRLSARGELAVSRLRVGDEIVSVLYDIRKGERQYNISMGFNPAFSSRFSLGLIHLGYAMEAAAERGVKTYDFLAGSGRSRDYKRHLSQTHRELSCLQVLRGPLLPSLYRWRDRVRKPRPN